MGKSEIWESGQQNVTANLESALSRTELANFKEIPQAVSIRRKIQPSGPIMGDCHNEIRIRHPRATAGNKDELLGRTVNLRN
jgi:hypothetical protein